MKHLSPLMALAAALSLTACAYTNHFLDEDESLTVDTSSDETLAVLENLNISTYDQWTYINIQTGEYEQLDDCTEWYYAGTGDIREAYDGDEPSIEWHIAVHRYELKTNDASALATGTYDITALDALPSGTYTADEIAAYEDEIDLDDGITLYMDMTGMMDSNIGYAHYPQINRVLCNAITRTATGSMPPYTYDVDGEVIALKWDNGDWGAVQIVSTIHTEKSYTGYLTFNFKYVSAE